MWRVRLVTDGARRGLFLPGVCTLAWLAAAGHASADIVIDGRIDESEWQQATRCEAWQRTEPFVRDDPRYGNDIRILSLEQGLAAAFIVDQPAHERRIKPRTPRDRVANGDFVGLVVDFDATGQVGYEFTVGLGGGVHDGLVTNQNKFDNDWDADWQHAVSETDGQWFVEILIPWSSVSMRGSPEQTRTIGVYASRYLSERSERYACPGISRTSAVFLSDFHRMQVSHHDTAPTLAVVPYGTVTSDLLHDETDFKAGADLIWKPTQKLQLTATLNPDFGQVESDELVVDFSAIETQLTDKRPFFTENQGIFDLRTPANGQLIYTRRIGGAPDIGNAGSSDIDAALKLSGTAGSLVYGGFVAQEDEYEQDYGRLFTAARLAVPLGHARFGYLGTYTDHPALERNALINAVDYELTPGETWRIAGQMIRSDIGNPALEQLPAPLAGQMPRSLGDTAGYEAWLQADYNRAQPVTHSLKLLYIDDDFDLNDLGFMERNSLRQVEWDTNRRTVRGLSSSVSGETQRLYLVYRQNGLRQRLPSRIQLSRDVTYTSAWNSYQELRYVTSGVDDLLSRGNGPVELDARPSAYADVTSPRYGDWQFGFGAYAFQQGVHDYSGRGELIATWYPTQTLTVRLDVLPQYSRDWLVWEGANLFGSYRAERLDYDFRVDWIPASGHELRLRWQWIGINAEPRAVYRTDPAGTLTEAPDVLAPFTVSHLGLQVRYRYEIGPMSELFLVYARGGFEMLRDDEREVTRLFSDSTRIRDSDQFLIKLRYRL
jgi:uncharacterized protein DUF5916